MQKVQQGQQYNVQNSVLPDTNVLDAMMDQQVYLSPDALMSYCATRLRGIDDQVQAAFAKQQTANADSSVLGALADDQSFTIPTDDKMNLDPGCNDKLSTGETANQQASEAVAALKEAAQKVSDPRTAQALLQAADKLQSDIDDKKTINGADFKTLTSGAVQQIQQDLNSGAELSMINLQSLMSQRQQAIQVCTNLVQSFGDQVNKIADNVGK